MLCAWKGLAHCTQSTGVIPNTLFTERTYMLQPDLNPCTGLENVPSNINLLACFKTGRGYMKSESGLTGRRLWSEFGPTICTGRLSAQGVNGHC